MADSTITFNVKAGGSYDLEVQYQDLACADDVPPVVQKIAKGYTKSFKACRSSGNPQEGNGEFSVRKDTNPPNWKRLYKYDAPYKDQLIDIKDADLD